MASAVLTPPSDSPFTSKAARPSFKQQMLQAREDAIIETVNRLLAEKGFDLMTVDEVAAQVGIAKASLYKHFPSKEDLATAAMVRALARTQAFLDALPAQAAPVEQLKAIVRWCLQLQLAGEMPTLPSENSSLRATLMASKAYMDGLLQVSDRIGVWIEAAQANGSLRAGQPPLLVLYTLFAKACDPVPQFLKSTGLYNDAQIVDMVLATCFDGLGA
jgi:TetR/AcrR family transcriptional regulator, regulator of autoinduction and epiphytic fitness